MKNKKTLFITAIILLFAYNAAKSQKVYKHLVWSDEFNYTGQPDSTKWSFETGNGCPENCGWGNNELEYYVKDTANCYVKNGHLTISAIKQQSKKYIYSSAKITTQNKMNFKYGRIEIRAKLPASLGTWPAIWMLGSNIATAPWPTSGEIDIMEHKGKEANKIYGTLHYPGHSGENANGRNIIVKDPSTKFHNYTVICSPKHIQFFVDNNMYFNFDNNKNVPFNHDFYLILNLAMGGGFGGTVDPNFKKESMLIDYIRVYK